MAFLASCISQMVDSPTIACILRVKNSASIQKHSMSAIAGTPPRVSRYSAYTCTLSSEEDNDTKDESLHPLASQSITPSLLHPIPSSLLSTSVMLRPEGLKTSKSADCRFTLPPIDNPLEKSFFSTSPIVMKSEPHQLPATFSLGHKINFSPEEFQLENYSSDKNKTLGRLSNPPILDGRLTSEVPTVYYSMPDSPATSSEDRFVFDSDPNYSLASVRSTLGDHRAYLETLKSMHFGNVTLESCGILDFSLYVSPGDSEEEDLDTWENVSLSQYGWK